VAGRTDANRASPNAIRINCPTALSNLYLAGSSQLAGDLASDGQQVAPVVTADGASGV
jgi:hypothetical protein